MSFATGINTEIYEYKYGWKSNVISYKEPDTGHLFKKKIIFV